MSEHIRPATLQDSDEILKIYEPYITHTPITFETQAPTQEAFRLRMAQILKGFPFLVYEQNGVVSGYAYASPYGDRAAYQYSAKVSIYLRQEHHSKGLGTMLYTKLLQILERQGFHALMAGVTMPNEKSVNLHKKLGFREVGVLRQVGYKLGGWHDLLWLEKVMKTDEAPPEKLMLPSEVGLSDILKSK